MSDNFYNSNGVGAAQHVYMYGGLTEAITTGAAFQVVSLNNVGANTGIVTTGTPTFDATIQEDGAYDIKWGANFEKVGSAATYAELQLFKNGAQLGGSQAILEISVNNVASKLVGFGIFDFLEGDVIDLRATGGHTDIRLIVVNGASSTDFSSFLSINKL